MMTWGSIRFYVVLMGLFSSLLCTSSYADDTDLFKMKNNPVHAKIMLVVDTSGSMASLEGNDTELDDFDGDCEGTGTITEKGETVEYSNSDRKICIVREILLKYLDPAQDYEEGWPDDIQVGLSRYREPGAVILKPLARLGSINTEGSHRNQLIEAVNSLTTAGRTPLVGSYLEVAEYLTGGFAVTRDAGDSDRSIWADYASGQYAGVDLGKQCGTVNNHLIFLTDGLSYCEKGSKLTTEEEESWMCGMRSSNPAFGDLGSRVNEFVTDRHEVNKYNSECSKDFFSSYEDDPQTYDSYWGCLSLISSKLNSPSFDPENVEPRFEGIETHVIAYDMAGASSDTVNGMSAWAKSGGGMYLPAASSQDLADAFQSISKEALLSGAFTVASGGAGVSQVNRFAHMDELYFSMFTPSTKPFWYGNLKKYFFQIDRSGELGIYTNESKTTLAVQNGDFRADVRSEWSDVDDGNIAYLGGAAGEIRAPDDRNLIVSYGGNIYEIKSDNEAETGEDIDDLRAALLSDYSDLFDDPDGDDADSISGYDISTLVPTLSWLMGNDVNDEWAQISEQLGITVSGNGVRNLYGAPLHSSPVLVNYQSRDSEGEPLDTPEDLVFISTNDGKLYAVDTKDGVEHFAYLPEAMLKREGLSSPSPIEKMYEATKPDAATGSLIYGLDSTWTVWRQDVNRNGNIDEDTQDFVYLYGGMRRGGRNYYILDATKAQMSKTISEIAVIKGGEGKFADNGQSWSEPRLAIVKFNGVAAAVFIVGGGYDDVYDNATRPASEDLPTKGAQIYMIVARDFTDTRNGVEYYAGDVLWWASSSTATLERHVKIDALKYSIPSSVKTVDEDGDGYLDFFYVGDMGGQIHRFDINEDNTGFDTLIGNPSLTVIAQLGVSASDTDSDDRRFFDPPSVAKMNCRKGT